MDDITTDNITCHSCHFNRAMFTDRKVLVTFCFHKICNVCLKRILKAGKGLCPACGKEIKQSEVQTQKFDDMFVDREIRVRKRMMRIFNKLSMDFPSCKEYDNYLEMVEDIIYNLANDIHIEETKLKIDQYKRENQEFIDKNRIRPNPDAQLLNHLIESETKLRNLRNMQYNESRLAEIESDQLRQAAILNELASSNVKAEEIVNHHNQLAYNRDELSYTMVKNPVSNYTFDAFASLASNRHGLETVTGIVEDLWASLRTDESHLILAPSFRWINRPLQYHDTYTPSEIRSDESTAILAGGYSIKLPYICSLHAAYAGLFVLPPPPPPPPLPE